MQVDIASETQQKIIEELLRVLDLISGESQQDEQPHTDFLKDLPKQLHKSLGSELQKMLIKQKEEALSSSLQDKTTINQLQCECDALKTAMEEKELTLEHVKLKMKNAQEKVLAKEEEQNKALMRLQKDLQSSQLALEQYKHDAQSLEDQLQKTKHTMKAQERELQLFYGQRAQSKSVASEDLATLQKEKALLLKDVNNKVVEIKQLEMQLEFTQKELLRPQL